MWVTPCVRKLSLYGKESINYGLQKAKSLLILWCYIKSILCGVELYFLKLGKNHVT